MAKRKRLGGPLQDYLATSESAPSPFPASSAPIARVAGETSVNAAFEEVSRELSSARSEGRLVLRLPLDKIEVAWLIRDRTHPGTSDDPEFTALRDSLRRNGQRSPIEVVDIGQGRFGLISGWRRLTALSRLHEESEDERFATVLAFVRQPASSEEAYVAMVEENEIRLGLSYYERARIAAKSVEAGVYPNTKAALQSLFASASRAKRSKIGSFLALYQVLGDGVRFPQALTERIGLSLAKILDADEAAEKRLRACIENSRPECFEAEQSLFSTFIEVESNAGLSRDLTSKPTSSVGSTESTKTDNTVSNTAKDEICPGLFLTQSSSKIQLSGPAVNSTFRAQLEAWLKERAKD